MNKELETVILEDGIEYIIIDEIIKNDLTYVYLVNINDEKDFCIRKINIINNEQHLIGLDSDCEFDKAMMYFTKDYGKMIKD